ncbi:unnamed protein product [Leptidea sinapis]|uniref:Odorant receptor n=1 Tax=Leptidea sinapis TaxID=189913 RepID=A0A5E4QEY8_9NEOP|nr:unnamed protein product [Leptidea sinapis]
MDFFNNDYYLSTEGYKYKTFHQTYKIIAFLMAVGLVYPNPSLYKFRIICIGGAIISVLPITGIILYDMYRYLLDHDYVNIIRHCTVVGPFLGGFLKMMIMHVKQRPARMIINEIDEDYASFNNMPEPYQRIIDSSIRNNLVYSEKAWVITVFSCVMIFPFMAIALNFYNFVFKSEPTKYMAHEVRKPYGEPEDRFNSPYFEIIFIYMLYCSIFYFINFSGYDGFFGICINHACLKMQLYCKAFEDALACSNIDEMRKRIVSVIQDQNRLFRLCKRHTRCIPYYGRKKQ